MKYKPLLRGCPSHYDADEVQKKIERIKLSLRMDELNLSGDRFPILILDELEYVSPH